MSETATLKSLADCFLKLAASGKVDEAYSKYVDKDFTHHNQYYRGTREALISGMKESSKKSTDKYFEVKTSLQEGDKVVTYSYMKTKPDEMEIAVFHMFKFKNGKIIEMWDVGQIISKESPNQNGMF